MGQFMKKTAWLIFIATMLAVPMFLVQAKEAPTVAADPVLEKRVLAITEELRCLVCQNQTIADSHADLAIDLKNQVREKLAQGMSDQEVKNYMVERYGDFVLYRPPVKPATWFLWFGPFLLLVLGIVVLLRNLAKRSSTADLSEAEQQRAAALLDASADQKK
jgi:cytochrome c-type biogenesis protein CcmH